MPDAESAGVCVGVVLAAGRSTRTGFPKALAELDGESFVNRAVRSLHEGGCRRVIVVVAAPHDEAIARALTHGQVARNPDPDRGMLSSLQIGVRAAFESEPELDRVVFALVDHPRVRPETVRELIDHARQTKVACVRPVRGGRGGHPVVISQALASRLLDSPAPTVREALRLEGPPADLETTDPGVLDDTDTEDAIRALGGSYRPA